MGQLAFFSAMIIVYLLLLCLAMFFCLLAIQLCQKVLPSSLYSKLGTSIGTLTISIIRFLSVSGMVLYAVMSWICRTLWANRELLYTLIGSIIPLDWYLRSVVPLFGNKDDPSTDIIAVPCLSCVQPISKLQPPRSSTDTRNHTANGSNPLLGQGLLEFRQLEVTNQTQTGRRESDPRSGEEIWNRIVSLQHPSLRQELQEFIKDEVSHEKYTRRRVRSLRRGRLRTLYRKMRKADKLLFKRHLEENVIMDTDHRMDRTQLYPCKPSGAPEHPLHIVSCCPTGKSGTYTHKYSPTLDPKNISMNSVILKGCRQTNCFAYDLFIRRVVRNSKNRDSIHKFFEPFAKVYEELYRGYRKVGGKITVILGKTDVWKWHSSIVQGDNIHYQNIYAFDKDRYQVLIERSHSSNQIRRIVIVAYHPAWLRRVAANDPLAAVSLDEAINLAAYLTGVEDQFERDAFTVIAPVFQSTRTRTLEDIRNLNTSRMQSQLMEVIGQ